MVTVQQVEIWRCVVTGVGNLIRLFHKEEKFFFGGWLVEGGGGRRGGREKEVVLETRSEAACFPVSNGEIPGSQG